MLSADDYLRVIQSRGERQLSLNRVYRNMRRRDLFLSAYGKLYRNKGATTQGVDPKDSIQGMSLARIDRIIEQLKAGTYKWKPSRRIYVEKSNGSQRPISIPSWSDKLVQEVIRMILEAYYEPQFRDSSHGFRPNRGCHTALQWIKRRWRGTKWFIEGDIKACFDTISPDLIIAILSRKIEDKRLLKLIREMLAVGYMEDWQYHATYSGVPQGGVISPLLSNLVLNELDKYVEDILIPQYTSGKQRRGYPPYQELERAMLRAKKQGDKQRYQQLRQQRRTMPSVDPFDPNFRRLRYCRYADDFILGLAGTKVDAKDIKKQIGQFLSNELQLTLSKEKTVITHTRSGKARFLGYDINTAWCDTKVTKEKDGRKFRKLNGGIQLRVPKDILTKWRKRYTRDGKPAAIGGYIELSDFEIVETYGAQLRGLVNYYGYASNIGSALNHVRWDCMESARKTLAAKHRIQSSKHSYQRYMHGGSEHEWSHLRVTIERADKKPLVAKCGESPLRVRKFDYSINEALPPKVVGNPTSELVTRLVKGKCELCGSHDDLEAHHVNSLRKMRKRWQGRNEKPIWVQNMIAKRRKTLVVCHSCHQTITHGKYDGKRIS